MSYYNKLIKYHEKLHEYIGGKPLTQKREEEIYCEFTPKGRDDFLILCEHLENELKGEFPDTELTPQDIQKKRIKDKEDMKQLLDRYNEAVYKAYEKKNSLDKLTKLLEQKETNKKKLKELKAIEIKTEGEKEQIKKIDNETIKEINEELKKVKSNYNTIFKELDQLSLDEFIKDPDAQKIQDDMDKIIYIYPQDELDLFEYAGSKVRNDDIITMGLDALIFNIFKKIWPRIYVTLLTNPTMYFGERCTFDPKKHYGEGLLQIIFDEFIIDSEDLCVHGTKPHEHEKCISLNRNCDPNLLHIPENWKKNIVLERLPRVLYKRKGFNILPNHGYWFDGEPYVKRDTSNNPIDSKAQTCDDKIKFWNENDKKKSEGKFKQLSNEEREQLRIKQLLKERQRQRSKRDKEALDERNRKMKKRMEEQREMHRKLKQNIPFRNDNATQQPIVSQQRVSLPEGVPVSTVDQIDPDNDEECIKYIENKLKEYENVLQNLNTLLQSYPDVVSLTNKYNTTARELVTQAKTIFGFYPDIEGNKSKFEASREKYNNTLQRFKGYTKEEKKNFETSISEFKYKLENLKERSDETIDLEYRIEDLIFSDKSLEHELSEIVVYYRNTNERVTKLNSDLAELKANLDELQSNKFKPSEEEYQREKNKLDTLINIKQVKKDDHKNFTTLKSAYSSSTSSSVAKPISSSASNCRYSVDNIITLKNSQKYNLLNKTLKITEIIPSAGPCTHVKIFAYNADALSYSGAVGITQTIPIRDIN